MRPSFHPRLINGPFGDPGLYISFLFEKKGILFDLGDISPLSSKDLLKVSHVFITHTHMDHFIGFDSLLRLLLGRQKTLHIFGPAGFLGNLKGKLTGYSWDLVNNYENSLILNATEVSDDRLVSCRFHCREGFSPVDETGKTYDKVLVKETGFSITTDIFNHGIPCLGFSFVEQFHVNIRKEELLSLGLEVGPWLNRFKKMLFENPDPDSVIRLNTQKTSASYRLGELTSRIALITPGQKITYLADILFDPTNVRKAISLAKDADHLFIEAAFLEKNREIAWKKHHLTAYQAGYIAGKSNVKAFTLFHYSPRNIGLENQMQNEAQEGFDDATAGNAYKSGQI